ncbi:CPBP family intramembrane metalloprotease [Hazenella sp. IB182353]|uniref:CPBP family intramembrane glutamic endopeptidase n=1 Tax=Polycladospora coralii TaxID=2771432 RepID=UPI0017473ED5|nr:CPBP family intramembrane glutamic endopeptidase [Polycladospora coralii]MBS7529119.1 CPBP family intramembrane metalloprotease [Polycladospora coralii]
MTARKLTEKQVLLSFYITQLIMMVIGFPLLWWQGHFNEGYFGFSNIDMWIWGASLGLLIVCIELILIQMVPQDWMDDGGINHLLLKNRSFLHICWIACIAGVVEEILFRGVIQEWLGIWGSTMLFALLHTRYLHKWLLFSFVVGISILFGFIVEWTGQLAPVIIAHTVIDLLMGLYMRFFTLKEG